MSDDVNGHVCVLVEHQFEDLELWYPVLRLREAGARVTIVGPVKRSYQGKRGLTAEADGAIDDVSAGDFDALVIPGGYAPDRLRRSAAVLELARAMDGRGAPVAFICHAGWVIASAGIAKGRRMTSFGSIKDDLVNAGAEWVDEAVVVDGNLISSRSPADLPVFCPALLEALGKTG